MYLLKSESSFDSAHFLHGYKGKCSNIHGHRWRVEANVYADELQEKGELKGMVIDFGDIKSALKDIADFFDHSLIYEKGTLNLELIKLLNNENFRLIEVKFRPTAENFAKHIFDLLEEKEFNVVSVTVYETPSNSATYVK
ncbi:6-carboxytetrahydropterin synthase QueD [Helicovermis profundi]|uniref:6-carboxy-5,6,7,8-tetrahydropterin synthase n=1 Tax=Helicovermis profundi TaxID=3065157 RepID=A0AAU9E4G4_9FIRM|nr:6-carboxytetrahydropterin synthase QueD [Clostridia bacterium S502]